ncbi:MAG: YggT family protein [Chloroflexi bacterium]|nr:YggT family protein [Chloroflexota bacterium]
MTVLLRFVIILCQVLSIAIFIRVILSWFPVGTPSNPFVAFVYQVTEPILTPLRQILPRTGALDFSPLVAIVILQVIQYFAARGF